jgi:hypothetical protein
MSESNRASAVVGDPAYMGYTILPKCNSFADTLTERLLPRFSGTEGWWFAFDNPVREDRSREVQECISLVGAGVMTANEARAKLGLPLGDETLDVPRVNGVALATPTVVSASSFTCCEGHGEKVRKDLSTVERQFADELRAWYERAVRGAVSESGAVEVVSDAELERIIVDGMRRVFREAARSAEEDVDGSVIDAAAARYARERSAELIRGITETLRTQVREVIANGIMAGESLNEIRARLMESGLSEIRSETVLRTELARVEQASRRLVYAEAGYDGKTWVLAGEPCPLCEGIDRLLKGTVVPIGEPFLRVGTTVMGTDGKAYFIDRDIVDAPQAHPNCRCTANFVRGGGAA